MSRAAARSKRAPAASQGPSQSQNDRRASQYQSQRTRSRRARVEEEDEEGEDHMEDQENEDEDVDMDDSPENDLQRKATALVRLALFTEQRRTSLKREEISKKVLGGRGRSFNHVLDLAQDILNKTFGMELVPLQNRDPDAEEEAEGRAQTGVKKKAAPLATRTYILRSTLDPVILEHAALTDEQLLEKELQEAREAEDADEDDVDWTPRSYGSIINWAQSDNLGAIGILYSLLGVILANGRVVSDVELRSYLRRLGLPAASGQISFPAHNTVTSVSVETYLSGLLRQNYLERVQVGGDAAASGAAKNKGKGKRGRVDLGGDEDGDGIGGGPSTWEWRWGSRAHGEVGEQAVAKWIAEFMVGDGEEDEEGDGGARERTEAARNRDVEKMRTGVAKAAGGTLSDLW